MPICWGVNISSWRPAASDRGTVLAAGAVLAGLVLVPVVNLITPVFGAVMMVHLHKRLTRGRASIAARREGQASLGNR